MGGIAAMGEVVADIYRREGDDPLELPFTALPGGAPANVAVGAARLGARASFIGAVGDDLFGEFILGALDSEGVGTDGVVRIPAPARTSVAFVELDASGGREFTFYRSSPAADELLSADELPPKMLAGASFLGFGSIPLIGGTTREAVRRASNLARESGVAVAFDVNLRGHLWGSIGEAREEIHPFLFLSEVVKLSEEELEPLLRVREPRAAAGQLFEEGRVELVLVTRGQRGAYYATPDFEGEVSPFPVEAVDSTGAGDAFLAAVLTHLSEGERGEERVREAVRRGAAAGAMVCRERGAMAALPGRGELEEFMEEASGAGW